MRRPCADSAINFSIRLSLVSSRFALTTHEFALRNVVNQCHGRPRKKERAARIGSPEKAILPGSFLFDVT
jgi:hypothetical protein